MTQTALRPNAEGVARHGVELRHLRYFVAVAEAGTFTQAAERLFIAQPTLSQQIRRLEEMVGALLLHRGPEGVRLTDAGAALLDDARTLLSMIEHTVRMTRQAAGVGRLRLRVAVCPSVPEALAAATVSRLRDIAADADVDVAWLETFLDTEFTLIGQHRADAGLGWLAPAGQALPAPLDVMSLGDFEPDAWIPSSHPAARQDVITLEELARLKVVHRPRRESPGIYDAWLASLRSADSRFEFADPPFRQSLPLTLAFAAAASRPTAVLTGPRHPTGERTAREDPAANGYEMVRVRLDQAPLTASAGLVWSGDLPRQLQQILFDVADGVNLHT
jgi:DNA-binding transcriptional LysR family regulator